MGENIGLFGWPMPEPRETAGRPEHQPTEENRIKIMMMLAMGADVKDVAKAVGLSQPTLRKHYFQELSQRRVARLQLDAIRWAKLYEKMIAGDVGAIKELGKVLEKHDMGELASRVAARQAPKREPERQIKQGKKELQREAAGAVRGKFAPPPAPDLLN